ncbi:hypothetical protein M405DRAFT_847527 [Rhizopogon salebrosus TDB-379]|nr:hypothetical protein M405DRAFT_847527 [Rhizopogon salebrosus TDB-379]
MSHPYPHHPQALPMSQKPLPAPDVPDKVYQRAKQQPCLSATKRNTLTPLKKKFNIKLGVHFLEERLAQLAPDQIDAALKQNINTKIEVRQRGLEIKTLKKLVLELERELGRLQRTRPRPQFGSPTAGARARSGILEDREHEIMELRRAQDSAERNEDDTIDHNASRHIRELDRMRAENQELRRQLEELDGLLIKREDKWFLVVSRTPQSLRNCIEAADYTQLSDDLPLDKTLLDISSAATTQVITVTRTHSFLPGYVRDSFQDGFIGRLFYKDKILPLGGNQEETESL